MTTTVTDSDREICNADQDQAAPERETPRQEPSTLQSAITDRNRLWVMVVGGFRRLARYWTPPAILTDQAPAIERIKQYARYGAWTTRTDGPLRAFGIAWCYLVAIPTLVVTRYAEWLCQRPGRFITVSVTVKMLTFLPPIAWAVDHLITPAARFVLRLFL